METIEATYRVTTPMFCGGADPEGPAELRLPSFKGVLRFWWRALAWGRFDGDLKTIQCEENKLFGSTETGQAHVLMRLKGNPQPQQWRPGKLTPGLGYLAGQGLAENGKLTRQALAPDFSFTVQLCFRPPDPDAATLDLLREACIATGLVGGLGARSRRGFGSLTLESLTHCGAEWRVPSTVNELKGVLSGLAASGAERPPYTAFSKNVRFVIVRLRGTEKAEAVLARIGQDFLRFRTQEKRYRGDAQEVRKYLESGVAPQVAPARAIFGLPHNYFFKDRDASVEVVPEDYDRRASPLFVHTHQAGTSPPIAVLALFESVFLPKGEQIKLSTKDRIDGQAPLPSSPELWRPIHEFLDYIESGAGV